MTRISNEERKAVIEGFYDEVAEGSAMDQKWKETMIAAGAPSLPDEPTPAQLDAWIELTAIVKDPSFIESMKQGVKADLDPRLRPRRVPAHLGRHDPRGARGPRRRRNARRITRARHRHERAFAGFAQAMNKQPDEAFRRTLRARFVEPDPKATRYWELVEILKGPLQTEAREPWPKAEWAWFLAASKHHLPRQLRPLRSIDRRASSQRRAGPFRTPRPALTKCCRR